MVYLKEIERELKRDIVRFCLESAKNCAKNGFILRGPYFCYSVETLAKN
jgi:hypothetical protein